MKKLLALLLVLILAFPVAACSQTAQTTAEATAAEETTASDVAATDTLTETDTEETPDSNVTITMWVSAAGPQVEAMQAAVKNFEAETGYTVDFSAPGDTYEELMKTKMAADDMPDVFDTHGWSVARYSSYLMPLNDMDFAANIDSQILPIITNTDGDFFVLPFDMSLEGIVYNVDVCQEAGVDVDSIKTWADFEAACDKVLAIGKNPIHMGGANSFTIGWYYDRVAPSYFITNDATSKAAELKAGTFDTATWEEISTMLDSWVTKGYLNKDCVTSEYTADISSIAANDTAFLFYGNVAVTLALAINPDVNLGMMPIPAKTADDDVTLIAGENVALGIWKDSKVKDAAVELLNYLAQPEVAKTIAEATGNKSALTNVTVDLGMIQPYLDKYASVRTFPFFDREYCPSGLWDTICTAGQDVLAQKDGAIVSTAKLVQDTFNDKFGE